MPDEIDEVTYRSQPGSLEVIGRQEPEPAVVLVLRIRSPIDGVMGTVRVPQSPEQARRFADYLRGTADAVTLEALALAGDTEAAELFAEIKKQLAETPPWFFDL